MSSTKTCSIEELMNWTVAEIQHPDFVDVKIKSWQQLTPEDKERCILKLRELKNQRDEMVQSSAVDANALMHKLNQVERSLSATPVLPPWDDFDPSPERVEEDREKEQISHDTLIKDNGRPCYPIELGFDVFDNEQYKDILDYWQRDRSSGRRVFAAQLFEWEKFRTSQQYHRRFYARRDWWHRFQEDLRERRRKFGLGGDLSLREVVAEQSKLDDWMEYQDYHLREYEQLEQSLKKIQEQLPSQRRALAEEGYPVFEEIEELPFETFFGMNLEWGDKVEKAKRKQEQMERKLRVVKARSEAAKSKVLGEKVERDRWIGWFAQEVKSRRRRRDELQRLFDEAKRDVEPYKQWWTATLKEWDEKGWDDWTEEGHRLIELETSSAEHRTKWDKKREVEKRSSEASTAHIRAQLELEFAEEVLEVARTEYLAPIVERAALITRTQKEMRFAEFHVEEEKESRRVLSLMWEVLDDLYSIPKLKEEMKRRNALLNWVEQQRRELIGDTVNTEQESCPRRSKRMRSKAHSSPRVIKLSGVGQTENRARLQARSTAKSILDPLGPGKVTKASKQKRRSRRVRAIPHKRP